MREFHHEQGFGKLELSKMAEMFTLVSWEKRQTCLKLQHKS